MSQQGMENSSVATNSEAHEQPSLWNVLAQMLQFSALLRSWHRILLPLGLILLVLVFINWGLRTMIGPDEPFDTYDFPYRETFEDTPINRWFSSGGEWSLGNKALVHGAANSEEASIFVPRWLPKGQAYRVSVDLKLSEETQAAGINFNAQYPAIQQTHQRMTLLRKGSQMEMLIGTVDTTNGFVEEQTVPASAGSDSLHLDIFVDEDMYDVHVDGQPLIEGWPLTYFDGLIGLFAVGGPTAFDNLTVVSIDDPYGLPMPADVDQPEPAAPRETGQLLYNSDFDGSAGLESWAPIAGEWQLADGMLNQLDPNGFDYGIAYAGMRFQDYALQLSLQHLEGAGGGALFNMPAVDRLNGGHMVRYSDRSDAIFWGYFDESGAFQGQGYAAVNGPGKEPHTLVIVSDQLSYNIYLDGQMVAADIPLQQRDGHIGLITSRSSAAFGPVEVRVAGDDFDAIAVPQEPAMVSQPAPVDNPGAEIVVASEDLRGRTSNGVVLVTDGPAVAVASATAESIPSIPESAINGWVPFSGRWELGGGLLKQVDSAGFDLGIGYYNDTYSSSTLEVTLRHLEGAGGGVLFNMAAPDQLAGAHMVRYSDTSDAIFWGYFDESGAFQGQGYARVNAPGNEEHLFRIESSSSTYTIYLDNQILARDLPLFRNSGYIGLISSQSAVAFGPISTHSGGLQLIQFERPVTTGDDFYGDIRTISGDWVIEESLIRQENPAIYDFSISTGVYANEYGLTTTITLPDSAELQDAGGGVLFHMPARSDRRGAHMVRFIGRDEILWGYYDEAGSFVGQGRTELAQSGNVSHTLSITVESDTYQIAVDGEVVALNVQLKQPEGWIGLVSYRGPVAFEDVSVTLEALQ